MLSTHENAGSGTDIPDVVEVRLPASSVYLSVLRTATAGLAARLNFTLDDNALDVHVRVATSGGSLPERDTFAWTVLSALAGDVDSGVDPDATVWIRLHKRRAVLGTR